MRVGLPYRYHTDDETDDNDDGDGVDDDEPKSSGFACLPQGTVFH